MTKLTDDLAIQVRKLRELYPVETANLTDMAIIASITATLNKRLAGPVGTEGLTDEERRKRLNAKNAPGEKDRHPVANDLLGPTTKTPPASVPADEFDGWARSELQASFSRGVEKFGKAEGLNRDQAFDRFSKTAEGSRIFKAMSDPDRDPYPTFVRHTRTTMLKQAENIVAGHRVSAAEAKMREIAKAYRVEKNAAGARLTEVQAYAAVLTSPDHRDMAALVREQEQLAAGVIR